jgi:putative transcriptional regulator
MSKTFITAKTRNDGTIVQILENTTEIVMHVPPLQDAPPLDGADDEITPEQFAKMRRVPRSKTMRRALGLTQEEFSKRYRIPLGTLRDWEQGRSEPDAPARAYLKIIAKDPEYVRQALAS